jgi:hypothetical protein
MYTPETEKPFFVRFQERLAASRFLTVSILIHAVLVLLGGSVVLFKQAQNIIDFSSDGGLVSNDAPVQAPPEQPPDLTQQTFTPQTPQINVPTVSAISTTNVTTPTFTVAAAVPQVKAMPTDAMDKALKSVAANVGAKGIATGLPGTMAGRAGGSQRMQAMQMNGGKKESEEAVMRGLRWLMKTQNADGSWAKGSKSYVSAMTGFALLSYLGHGETPVSAEFGPTIQKALDWTFTNGKKNEGRLSMEATFTQGGVYAHGILAYGLGEYYTMTKDERFVDLFKQAIGYIVAGQGPDGGWMYAYDKSESDTSVSGWQIQALKAAHLSGLNIEGVDAALDKAMLNLKRVQGPKGGFGYRKKEDRYSLTGVGVLCTYFWKQEKDSSVRSGIEFLMDETKKTYPVEYKHDKANLYAWYYNTQACLMVGGAAWNTWNRMFQEQIVKNQSADGSWPPMASKPGGGELQVDPEGAGPFYRTNLCILMLEVYYRYMPTTK